jgi:peptide/nickel transport system permease protein
MSAVADDRAVPAPRRRRTGLPIDIALCAGVLGVVVVMALFAPLIAPYDYATQNLGARFRPPVFWGGDWRYPLGTDNLGRDILSRLIYGTRVSIAVALAGTLIGAVTGVVLGILAAHFRGVVDTVISLMIDVQAALPVIVLALAALAFFGNNLVLFVLLVGLHGWDQMARQTRALVRVANASGYAKAIEEMGASPWRVYALHVVPNITAALIVQVTLNFPVTIILETSISFLGLGIQPPMTSLGQMLGQGRLYLLNAWWIAVVPGLVIFFTTLSVSLIGDYLRDRLDPTLERKA